MQTKLFSNLAGDLTGAPDRRPPLVLLHGLTFDRTMWRPALAHLAALDPGRPVLALDLPGTGHFPHLARPAEFAGLLAATGGW
jgi:pimeloyl-ACP methyl ester carboxylesterase